MLHYNRLCVYTVIICKKNIYIIIVSSKFSCSFIGVILEFNFHSADCFII